MGRKNKCKTWGCKNNPGKRKKCSKCRMRDWRAKYPDKAAYHRKKTNARRRGIPFNLTFEDFMLVYVKGYVLDRDDATRGYELGNVLPMSIEANAIKGATLDKKKHEEFYWGDEPPF